MRYGWLALGSLLLAVACGGPQVTDLDDSGVNGTPDPTNTTDPTGSPTPDASATPSPTATVTGLPSFTTYDNVIRGIQAGHSCNNCHIGGSGGFSNDPTEESQSLKEAYWFSNICIGNPAAPRNVTYDPPAGRLFDLFCVSANQARTTAHTGGAQTFTNADCGSLDAWLREGTADPPPC